ncbi:CU044_5270 family protein [Streptomyces sp. NPDC057682]|uniref:CU044_5270 family protein n=1 Tax=unclassified Streptomyces TaxID=2593676 RepID=UPI00366237F4
MDRDEMTLVRELRADAPVPDRAALAAGRQRLTEAAGRRRRVRADWRLAVVATVAAVALGGAVTAGVVGGVRGADPAAAPVVTERIDAAAALRDAAARVADDPVPTPRDGQWVYTEVLEVRAGEDGPGEEAGGPRRSESWHRYADPAFENGRSGDDHSPRERFRFLAGLPSAPAEVRKRARAFYPGDGEPVARHDFRALSLLAASSPADPEGLAAVYRAMATVPGLEAVRTEDALHRPVIGIGFAGDRELLLLDADTLRYAGWGSLDSPTADGVRTVVRTALVDADGDRP